MSRKSQYINSINNRDIQSFRLLFYAHHVPRSLMRASDSRLRSYEKQGLVEKCVSIGTGEAVYKCTDKGRNFIGKLDGFAGHKPYLNANSSEHNCLLAQQIASLPDNLQAGWYSERDLWGMYQDRLDEIRQSDYDRWEELSRANASAVDGGVVVGGEMVLVEVISEHYNSIALESKENFATVLGTGVHYFHT